MKRLAWSVCVILTLAGSSALAAVVVALDLPSLTREATVVAELEVVGQQSRRLDGGSIVTEYEALVLEGVKGVADGDELHFFAEGGVVDGVGAWVPGEPRPAVGDRLVAFLQPAAAGLRFVGMSQGCLPVAAGPQGEMVLPPRAGALLVRRTAAGLRPAPAAVTTPRRLRAFLDEVRALATR